VNLRRHNRLCGALTLRHIKGEDVRFMAPEVAGPPPPLRAFARALARWPAFEPESFVARLTPDERSWVGEARAWLRRKGLRW
jgi:hypothetical protein